MVRDFEFVLSLRLGLLQPHHSAVSHCPVKPWRSTSEIVVETHPLPLWTTPLGCLVQVVTGASLQVSVPRVRLGCPAILLGVLVVFCFRFFVLTVASKALPCVGFYYPLHPSTPLWNGLALLCSAALRYSSLMFQDPHGTSVKALEYPLWFSRALSPPVRCCLLAPSPPSFVWGIPVSVFGPAPAALPSLLSASSPSLASGFVCDWLLSPLMLKFGDSCDLSCCSGARIHCLRVEFALYFTGAAMSFLSFCGFSPPLLHVFFFGLFALSLFVGVCVGSFVVVLSLFVWVGEVGPGPEPWTGLHCSELYWR